MKDRSLDIHGSELLICPKHPGRPPRIIDSRPGEGATFIVALPAASPADMPEVVAEGGGPQEM